VRQRLTLLETSLLLSGRVNTVALTSRFGISRAQASKDLALYQKLRPHNLVYDRFLKNYVITDRFEPLLVRTLPPRSSRCSGRTSAARVR
jgi:hypothetical protein